MELQEQVSKLSLKTRGSSSISGETNQEAGAGAGVAQKGEDGFHCGRDGAKT
jgi:hypothetical protein